MLWLWHFSSNYSIHWNVNKHTARSQRQEKWNEKAAADWTVFFFSFFGASWKKNDQLVAKAGMMDVSFLLLFKKKNNRNGPKQQPPHWLFSKKMPCCSIHWRNVAVCIYVRECILNLLFVYLFKFLKNKQTTKRAKHVWSMWPASTFRLFFFSYLLWAGWCCFNDIIQRRAGTVQIVGIVRVLSLISATEINKKQQGNNDVQRYQMMKQSFKCCHYSFCDMIESGESCARPVNYKRTF